jgi:ERCC4-type nuclease
LEFSKCVHTITAALPVGDYSLHGLEDQVVIERKSLGDLLGSITHGRDRFVREFRQLRSFRFAGLLVEADWDDIETRHYPQKVHANAVYGSLVAFCVKYGVHGGPILGGDHVTSARICERLLMNYARLVERDYKSLTSRNEVVAG